MNPEIDQEQGARRNFKQSYCIEIDKSPIKEDNDSNEIEDVIVTEVHDQNQFYNQFYSKNQNESGSFFINLLYLIIES